MTATDMKRFRKPERVSIQGQIGRSMRVVWAPSEERFFGILERASEGDNVIYHCGGAYFEPQDIHTVELDANYRATAVIS